MNDFDDDQAVPSAEEFEQIKALLATAVELLGTATCDVHDPHIRRRWGTQRRDVTDGYYNIIAG